MTKNKYKFLYDEESHRDDGAYLEEKYKKGILADNEAEAEQIVEDFLEKEQMKVPYYAIVDWEDEE
jgi:hypothetical protein